MNLVDSGMSAVAHIGNTLKANAAKMATSNYRDMASQSLSQYSTELQLRPTFAIESELLNVPEMGTLIQTGLSNYAGYYIIALSVDNTINGVSVGKSVGKYSPTRDATGEAVDLMGQTIVRVSTSSYKPALPTNNPTLSLLGRSGLPSIIPDLPAKYLKFKEEQNPEFSKEDFDSFLKENLINGQYANGNDMENTLSVTNTIDDINKLANLGVGRILTVNIAHNDAKAQINMLLKPDLKSIKSGLLVEIAGITKKPMTMRERWTAFWDRETIHSAYDWLTCRDLAEAHRRNLVEDTSGYYEKTHRRNVNNKIASLLTGNFSVGTVANTWIVSEQTALRIQAAIGAKFNNKKARDKFMAESGCMTLIVFNPDYQRIFIYNHGIDDVSEISMNYLEKKQKSESFDFDVFKMLAQGSAPII